MSSDQHPTQPLPDLQAQWVLSTPSAPQKTQKRRRWPWLVAVIVIGALVLGAWFAGEHIARGIVERTIREQAVTQLSLPADQQIDVDLPWPVLPALLVGNLAEVTVSSEDVPLNGITADVVVRARDVPIRRGGDWSGASATVSLDEAQLQALLSTVEGFPAETVEIDAPEVAVTFELNLLVATVPVGVGLKPRAEEGELVLAPSSLRVAGVEISAEAVLQQFGAIASTVVRDWDVCVAEYLPAALTLTEVRVESGAVVADFEIDSAILTDETAREKGTCA